MRAVILGVLLSATVISSFTSFCDTNKNDNYVSTFSEEFDGEILDETVWSIIIGSNVGACRSAMCTTKNVYLEDGQLVLRSLRSGKQNFTTGAIWSMNKTAWRVGEGDPTFRMCISAQLPSGRSANGTSKGIWPAHWLMPDNTSCDPDEGEPDIMEMVNGDGIAYQTYHWMDTYPEKTCAMPDGWQHNNSATTLADDWDTTSHEFAIERSANHITYALDGEVTLRLDETSDPAPKLWNVPFHLILNTAIGGSWPGEPDETTGFPAYHKIDYVRVVTEKEA